ncbi:MAG: hypothetical protein KatS3mg105_3972 [Gemmatales bacterium]|nr:MAG: hypothetical protein KatS3mg105_3972 [Gemmatales bacterium]
MSEYLGDTTSSASEKPGRFGTVLTLTTARKMLPLVRHIVESILSARQELTKLLPEQIRLERCRRNLPWAERARRYQLQDDIDACEKNIQVAIAELESLGVTLLDEETGRVGFPTRVNSRKAYFSWTPEQDTLIEWHYADDNTLRKIPANWVDPKPRRSRRKG